MKFKIDTGTPGFIKSTETPPAKLKPFQTITPDIVPEFISKGETKIMSTMSVLSFHIESLERMANLSMNADLERADVKLLSANIRESLERQLKVKSEAAASAAAFEIVKLLKAHDVAVEKEVHEVRELRKTIKKKLQRIKTLNISKTYGLATNNFLPLAKAAGLSVCAEEGTVVEVPKDWVAPIVEEKR